MRGTSASVAPGESGGGSFEDSEDTNGSWMQCQRPSMASNMSERGVRTSECVRDDRPSLSDGLGAADEAAVLQEARSMSAPGSNVADGAAHHPPPQTRTT